MNQNDEVKRKKELNKLRGCGFSKIVATEIWALYQPSSEPKRHDSKKSA
jgi:hypothetical protein